MYEFHTEAGRISIIPAGRQDADYAAKVNQFDWQDFYKNWYGYNFIEYLRRKFREKADIIIVDSRTGVTDNGGICTMQLPDLVILFYALNAQNIYGTRMIAESITGNTQKEAKREQPPKLLLISSRVDISQTRKNIEWEEMALRELGKFLPGSTDDDKKKYIFDSRVPYVPDYSYGEELAVRLEDPLRDIGEACDNLATRILDELELKFKDVEVTTKIPVEYTQASAPARKPFFRRTGVIATLASVVTAIAVLIGGYQLFLKNGDDSLLEYYTEAVNYYKSGDLIAASDKIDMILEKDPENRLFIDLKDAIEEAKVQRIDSLLGVSDHLEKEGEVDAALDNLRQILELDPDNEPAREAARRIHRLSSGDGLSPEFRQDDEYYKYFLQGMEYYRDGNYADAIATWERVLEKYPKHQPTLENIRQARMRLDQLK